MPTHQAESIIFMRASAASCAAAYRFAAGNHTTKMPGRMQLPSSFNGLFCRGATTDSQPKLFEASTSRSNGNFIPSPSRLPRR
mmetsp:Transcript_4710/g.14372  ORF Transcript_4710/g.14372 Transcript_4710/m.14372 type:complete len:83 (-) Transcript_4710:6342-6590(-)